PVRHSADDSLKALIYKTRGVCLLLQGDARNGSHLLDTARQLALASNNPVFLSGIVMNLASCYLRMGEYPTSLEWYQRAIQYSERTGDLRAVGRIYGNMALVFDYMEDDAKAEEMYRLSLQTARQIGDSLQVAKSLTNLAGLYVFDGNIDTAIAYFSEAARLDSLIDNIYSYHLTLGNLGLAHMHRGDTAEANCLFDKVLAYQTRIGDRAGTAAIMCYKAQLHNRAGRYAKALPLARAAYEIDKLNSETESVCRDLRQLEKAYASLENWEDAYLVRRELDSSENALVNLEKAGQISEIEARERAMRAEREAAIRALEKERIHNLQYLGGLLFIVVLFGGLLLRGNQLRPSWVRPLLLFTLILFIEFLFILTDPLTDRWSGGNPILKLGMNTLLALAILPIHSFLDRIFRRRMGIDNAA
ncbi:MAG: tetratricopeptide repeat protein, partial [Flavobacteriales bacterium]|nr:tetratricopeptide repeat protein [Flavobacteriales bacterium]